MSGCDPYRELELYLEKAHDEICQVFEAAKNVVHPIIQSNQDGVDGTTGATIAADNVCFKARSSGDWESDVLVSFETRIAADIKELLTRYKLREELNDCTTDDDAEKESIHGCDLKYSVHKRTQTQGDEHYPVIGINVDCSPDDELLGSQTTLNSMQFPSCIDMRSTNTTGTQTSYLKPSPSHSSTNLTSWSEYSSSPCLTSKSDPDGSMVDGLEDNISLTSIDGLQLVNKQQAAFWSQSNRPWPQELSTKSSSAPVLKKVVLRVNKQTRSQSDRHLSEIEATEACKWLRAAGFPQYAQMYEDQQFPVDVAAAEQDHPLLEPSVLHSLFRRLQALNRCARVHQQRVAVVHHADDSEDEQCALSDNWTYQSDLRRWSRNCQNIQIVNNEEWPLNQQSSESAADADGSYSLSKGKLRRSGSSKYRRRNRDGVVISETGSNSNVLDLLSRQLSSLSSKDPSIHRCPIYADAPTISDYGCTNRHCRKKKTRSLDKNDTWYNSASHTDRQLWRNLGKTDEVEECRLDLEDGGRPISSLSCTQLQVLRKLALLKLTAHMEKYCPSHRSGWNWDLPKLIRKIKNPVYKEKSVFGVPITIILQRSASSMPKGIEEALEWLQQTAYDQVGLFRKSGVKSRIQNLKMMVESQRDCLNFSEHQAYDIADMVKQYFRELPEALLTNKLSETFILIFQYVPEEERRQAVLSALLLMPDEHCEVLQCLLNFLTGIAEHSAVNQMNDSNLAVCFAPSLFHYNQVPSNRQNLGSPHPRELAENKAAHDCLLYLLKNCTSIFSIPKELLKQCTSNEMKESRVVQLSELGMDNGGNWKMYLQECQNMLLREVREKGWIPVPLTCYYSRVELAYKKVADGHPLRLWKASAEIEAPPGEVLFRILRERHKWDEELHSTRTVAQLPHCADVTTTTSNCRRDNSEVFQFTRRNISPLPLEDYCVVRSWRTDLARGACLIVETSVEHPDAVCIPNSVRGIVLASRYLIEPCGSGRSRLIHLSRVDTRGRMPEWYHKNYGHICALHIANIQTSFKQNIAICLAGPESKV